MYGGRSTTDPYASYPPARSSGTAYPYPQGLPAQATLAGDVRLTDDVLDLAGYEGRATDVGRYDAYQPPPPTAPTMLRSQEAEDEHHGRLVMMDLAGAAPGPASAPDPGQVRILGGPPSRSQFSEGWAAPSGYVGTGGGLRSNGRVALIAACIAATIGVAAAVVISTVNAPGAARVEFGTSEPIELQTSDGGSGNVGGVVPGDPAQAVASAPAATTAPIVQRSVELAPVRRPGSTSVKPRVVGPTKATTKPAASPSPTKASPTPSASRTPSAEPTPSETTPSPAPTTSPPTAEPTPTASQPAPQATVPSETLPTAAPITPVP
jgi:hypothetical protein